MTHGCSLFTTTRRSLTALDIVTAHSTVPGREDVALLLEEAMRGQGWSGGRMEAQRRSLDERTKRRTSERLVRDDIGKTLGVNPRWWDGTESDASTESESDEEDESYDKVYVSVWCIPVFCLLTHWSDTTCRLFVYACLCSSIPSADF